MPDGRILRVFRNKRGIDLILQARGGISAFFRQDEAEMTPVDGVVLNFDQKIDFFEWDGCIFVCNLGAFESLTNVRAVTVTKAADAVDAFARRFHLPGADAIKQKLANSTKLSRKLAAAAQHGVIDDVNGDALIQRVAEKDINLIVRKEGEEFFFEVDAENGQDVEEFVNLLTDFYLHSPVTQREWKAYVKKPDMRAKRRPAVVEGV